MNSVNVLIVSRETIKPSSPTPQNLKCFKLSLLDQLAPAAYVPMILYYAPTADSIVKNQERINLLKKSLSQTLTKFYPLAGRVKQNLFIECNDQGIDFIEAKLNCSLSDILRRPEAHILDRFLPQEYHFHVSSSSTKCSQMGIQVNSFSCGGMAIGTSISHKLVDGITFTSFINTWAAMARGSNDNLLSPIFVGPHIFPPKDIYGLLPVLDIPKAKNTTKRFVFDLSKIGLLRERLFGNGNSSVNNKNNNNNNNLPSRVEIVSALIWKCAIDASRTKKPSFSTQTVNLRARMDPPLPESAAGNLLWLAIAPAPSDGSSKIEIQDLVYQVRNALKKFDTDYVKKLQGENGSLVLEETLKQITELALKHVDIYRFTSLRKFQLYEGDFGWGKPVWISSAGLTFKNVVVLIESRAGDRVEAWVTLDQQEMAVFECNQEILSFDSPTHNSSFLLLNSNL
ncbi:hypothetical protein JCGZ_11342 [Jatropha curcas]|uniref:Uncharacterized protein n=1 Tax=Jatropha curcas TaxID=180498 RepID=A0A067K411_JATCU|nr:stemmadenine O-acetyltransferase [Jatropha curcas]KDP30966.1 hypothetical protein JCGZ_11342 [Jatropha curcas]